LLHFNVACTTGIKFVLLTYSWRVSLSTGRTTLRTASFTPRYQHNNVILWINIKGSFTRPACSLIRSVKEHVQPSAGRQIERLARRSSIAGESSLTIVRLLRHAIQRRADPHKSRRHQSCLKPTTRRPNTLHIHCVSTNVQPLVCCNFDTREQMLTFSGRNATDKVGNQKTLYYATSHNLCFCIT